MGSAAKLIAIATWIAGLLLAAATTGPSMAREPDSVEAVEPGGPGVLTKCRDWLVTTSCKRYHHIDLPPRIAVGDTISVTFGSHPKEFRFPVARIAHQGRPLRDLTAMPRSIGIKMDKINVAPCYRASTGR